MTPQAILCVLVGLTLAACVTTDRVPFRVDSSPRGARVEVDGISYGKTPTTIYLPCTKSWVGIVESSDGRAPGRAEYRVVAYSPIAGAFQTKLVNPCDVSDPPGRIYFDLRVEHPLSPPEVRANSEPSAPLPRTAATAAARPEYVVDAAEDDDTFVINGHVFEAQTYCFGLEEGHHVIFLEGSPVGACASAKLFVRELREVCEVWCE